jgi:hypothetical protein
MTAIAAACERLGGEIRGHHQNDVVGASQINRAPPESYLDPRGTVMRKGSRTCFQQRTSNQLSRPACPEKLTESCVAHAHNGLLQQNRPIPDLGLLSLERLL